MPCKKTVADRFSLASDRYFKLAQIQNDIALHATKYVPADQGLILDIGCASGEHSQKLGKHVIGVDLSLGMVSRANRQFGSGTWINADMEALPFADCRFSHVFSSMAMQWSESPCTVLAEIERVLSRKGSATLVVPVSGAFWQLKQSYELAGLTNKVLPLFSVNHWLGAAKTSGFRINSFSETNFVDTHTSLLNTLRSISKIGASSHSNSAEPAKRLTKQHLAQLEHAYPKYRDNAASEWRYELDYRCLILCLEK